jgi:putative transport protein
METLAAFLAQQPLLALFLVVAAGYAIGAIDIKGFSLGVGAVLFSGLLIGVVSPKSQPPAILGTIGLVLFLYGLGVQFGRQFFAGLAGRAGRRYNVLAAVAIASAAVVAIIEMTVMDVSAPMMAGLFAGSGTNAATMQAAMEAAGTREPAIGYSVAFPFGLVGAILCLYVMQLFVKPNIDAVSKSGLETLEVAIHAEDAVGRTLGEAMARMPAGVQVLAVRLRHENRHPEPALVLGADDVLFLGSLDKASLESAREMLGRHAAGRMVGDRSTMDLLHVFVSKPHLVGTRLSDLKWPDGIQATITHVQRGDTEMLTGPDLTLEAGDRVGLLTHRNSFAALRKFFGNSIRGTSEFSYVSLGVGMVLGSLLGILPIPVPGLGTMKVGVAGGTLIGALILGKLGRLGPLNWAMPMAANLTIRNFGLSVFLAQVGMSSGTPFVEVVAASGPVLLAAGAAILLALALPPLLIGHYVMRIPFEDLLGITSGVTGSPAILAYAFRSFPSERVEICYAMIFPAATVMKIIIAQLIVAVGAGG